MNAVTLLHAHAPRPLAKTWKADGKIARYPNLKTFSCAPRPVGGIRELSELLAELEGAPRTAIIRGELREGIDPEEVQRNNATFEDVPRPWLALDVDEFKPAGADPVADPAAAVAEFLATHLPEFEGIAYHWQLTGSAGHPTAAGELKARLWFWLDEPRISKELKSWAKDRWQGAPPFDTALFSATQLHYTAAPVFEEGVADPVPVRSGFVEGAAAVSVPIVEEAAPAVGRQPVWKVSDAYAAATLAGIYEDIEETPPGTRNIVLYQKAYRAFSLIHTGQADEAKVRTNLEAAAYAGGQELEEIAATLNSAWRASKEDPDPVGPPAGDAFEGEYPPGGEEQEQRAQTDRIVAFVRSKCELFHDDNDAAYARDHQSGEVWGLGSRAFRNWLTAAFYATHEKAVRDQALREARMTLEGLAMREHRPVYVRTAGAGGSYWLDLGIDGDSRAIHLRAGAWSVEEQSKLMFCRSESAQPLPVAMARVGSIQPLWRIANVPPGARLLVVAWLVECLRPDTPFPVLELLGEQGSGKSGTQSALRRLIDPNAADLRGTPKSAEDLFISGGANHIISLENVSHLPAPLQDAMCVVATGGGFAKRKLYTDGEEVVITMKRPIILNGIAASVTQQDLVSRTLSVEMPVIQDAQAKDRLEEEFDANRGNILGGLLDIAAKALEILPKMSLPAKRRPRLVEFAYLGMAVAKALGQEPEDFMRQFEAARQDGLERTLEASPVATAIRAWAADYPKGGEKAAGQWLAELVPYRPSGTDAWPKSAKGLGDAMRRAAPALRGVGVECRPLGNIGGYVKWRIAQLPGYDFMTCMTSPSPRFTTEERHPLL